MITVYAIRSIPDIPDSPPALEAGPRDALNSELPRRLRRGKGLRGCPIRVLGTLAAPPLPPVRLPQAQLALGGRRRHLFGPLLDHLVDQAEILGHIGGQEGVALERVLDLLQRLTGMMHVDIV